MSVDSNITFNEAATESYRTWRLEIYSDHGSVFKVRIHREKIVVRDSDSAVIARERLGVVERKVDAALLAESETAAGVTATIQQLYALIASYADRWAQEAGEPSATS
jgi:hypothetical protein